jgi:hypothetical protein
MRTIAVPEIDFPPSRRHASGGFLRFCFQVNEVNKISVIVLVASLLGAVFPAAATRVDGLFEASVDAAGRNDRARDAALGAALEQVLVRLTGSSRALQSENASGLLANPGRFVEQFRYSEMPVQDGSRQLRLWVQFDGVSLARELRQRGLPYWGPERPDILAWLAVDDRGRRFLVSEGGDRELGSALGEAARVYGLAVTLPLLDLQDQREIGFGDVWGGFPERVEAASQRYRPQVVLTGRLDRGSAAGDWRADWQAQDQGERRNGRAHGPSAEAALGAAVAQVAEWLAQRYAVVASGAGTRALVVDNVRNLGDYARVSDYLASLSPVERVDVRRVSGDRIEFNLALSADESSLRKLIALGRILRPGADPMAWQFRLNP